MKKQPLWTTILGALSAIPGIYFWGCGITQQIWRWECPGAPIVIIPSMLVATLASAAAAYYGSRRWYLVTVFEAGTFLLIGFRMH